MGMGNLPPKRTLTSPLVKQEMYKRRSVVFSGTRDDPTTMHSITAERSFRQSSSSHWEPAGAPNDRLLSALIIASLWMSKPTYCIVLGRRESPVPDQPEPAPVFEMPLLGKLPRWDIDNLKRHYERHPAGRDEDCWKDILSSATRVK